MQMFEEGDLDLDDELVMEDEEVTTHRTEEEVVEREREKRQTSHPIPPRFPRAVRPVQKQQPLKNLLDNPSIQLYPQRHTQVKLDAVQSLSDVFDQMYVGDGSSGYSTETQTSWDSGSTDGHPQKR